MIDWFWHLWQYILRRESWHFVIIREAQIFRYRRMRNSVKLFQCLLWLFNIGRCLTDLLCTSSLRKTAFQSLPTSRIPLLGAEVDVLMQRRNTRIGSMYPTHDDLYNDRLAKNAFCGRNDVEIAIKAIQRFTLQRELALQICSILQAVSDWFRHSIYLGDEKLTGVMADLIYLCRLSQWNSTILSRYAWGLMDLLGRQP